MIPKPRHLEPEYGAQFQDRSIVDAYQYRPPYPTETFKILAGLMSGESRVVLDVGCGRGDIARELVHFVERVDAVDFSANMIETGKKLPGGDNPKLNWICGPVEEVPLAPPYALVTAGASLHWMDWYVVMPRFREMLLPDAFVAIVGTKASSEWWDGKIGPIISRYSTNRHFQPYDLIEELEKRGLFQKAGEKETAPVLFVQSVDDYIESYHSRNGLSRERMGEENAAAFDREVREVVTPMAKDGMLEFQISGHVIWGLPQQFVGK
ncbi:MAG TPA: class I SAM-dependent methyltransferase [Ktedonobacteraceae bacterium]|nr:class I SAM-dependent methyltransferase [Ktedonobacteraceae bacterium]